MQQIKKYDVYSGELFDFSYDQDKLSPEEKEKDDLVWEADALFMKSNPLHVTIFTSSFKLEADLIQMVNNIYRGNMESCGAPNYNMDDQAHCVVMAYKNWGKTYKNIKGGNIVALSSIHPWYAKACWNHDIELRTVQLDHLGNLKSLGSIRKLIDEKTICIIVSAPANATGRMEPAEDIAWIAQEY